MRTILKYTSLMILYMLIVSCDKYTEGHTVDPVNPTQIDNLSKLLTGTQVQLIGTLEGELARNAGVWARSFTGVQSQYASLENYSNVTANNYDSPWGNIYDNALINIKLLKRGALEKLNDNMVGIAQTMEAQLMGTSTALFGDIPFSEAGKFPHIVSPKFDPQSQVYQGVQLLLDSAIANLTKPGADDIQGQDVFYEGDVNKWIKAAYSLKARFYLHVRDYANVLKYAPMGITSSADNMMAPHGTANDGDRNIYFDFHQRQRPGYIDASSSFALALLDPASQTYRGNAKTNELARANYYFDRKAKDLNVENGFFSSTTKFPLVTYEETILTLAEAQARMDQLNEALASLNEYRAYLTADATFSDETSLYAPFLLTDFGPGGIESVSLNVKDALIKEIIEERYISLTGQIEVYNDLRRTKNLLGITPARGTVIPERFLYAQNELNTNPNKPTPVPDLYEPTAVNK